jgi:aspartate carbamoyltransferase regulatory subunit
LTIPKTLQPASSLRIMEPHGTVSTLHNFGVREKAQLMSASEMQRGIERVLLVEK